MTCPCPTPDAHACIAARYPDPPGDLDGEGGPCGCACHDAKDVDIDGDGPCWCGEDNPAYLDDGLSDSCGGTGILVCLCGGDFCVCHNHGEVECGGCEDCDGDGDLDDEGAP